MTPKSDGRLAKGRSPHLLPTPRDHCFNRMLFFPVAVAILAFAASSCSTDEDATVTIATTSSAGNRIDPNATTGQAKGYALDMKMILVAMTNGGQPTIANLEEAHAAVAANALMSGLDDFDNDGDDDDGKVTLTVDTDQACLAHQDSAWTVVDGKC